MPDLTDFLLARIAEDEAVAREAAAHFKTDTWTQSGGDVEAGHPTRTIVEWQEPEVSRHIARHDPARVLAECEAKRRIVEYTQRCIDEDDYGFAHVAEAVQELLALPYADHPDYREEWKP